MVQKVEKRRKTGLTGLRKKAAQLPSRIIPDYDKALDFIRRIETLAGLLQAAGQYPLQPVEAGLVSEATGMIHDETARLRRALATLVHVACEK